MSVSDDARRFASIARLVGDEAQQRLLHSHMLVIGIGGVGSWVAEALARSGVGSLTLMDLDHVALSNVNRQVHALESTLGQSKVQAMADRIAQINPRCHVHLRDEFLELDKVQAVVEQNFTVIIDATDQVRIKARLAAAAQAHKQSLVVCGAAGGKADPTQIATADLSQVNCDPLLASMRQRLRKEYGFAKAPAGNKRVPRLGVSCVYSREPMRHASPVQDGAAGLACAGYGSIVTVTASLGFAAAALAMQWAVSAFKESKAA